MQAVGFSIRPPIGIVELRIDSCGTRFAFREVRVACVNGIETAMKLFFAIDASHESFDAIRHAGRSLGRATDASLCNSVPPGDGS